MSEAKFLVEVFGGVSQGCGCSCSDCGPSACGPTVPTNELVERLAGELNSSYGAKVEVKYIDTELEGLEAYPVIDKVISAGYPFPITSINGEPKLAGAINLDSVKKLLDEMEQPASTQ
jgi:thiol-disulfide isomerase/thioredoxin